MNVQSEEYLGGNNGTQWIYEKEQELNSKLGGLSMGAGPRRRWQSAEYNKQNV